MGGRGRGRASKYDLEKTPPPLTAADFDLATKKGQKDWEREQKNQATIAEYNESIKTGKLVRAAQTDMSRANKAVEKRTTKTELSKQKLGAG